MYLIAELTVLDHDMLRRYGLEVGLLMTEAGGEILAISSVADTLEGDWRPDLLVLHRWRSRRHFDRFWASAEYASVRDLRRAACKSRIVVLDGSPPTGSAGQTASGTG